MAFRYLFYIGNVGFNGPTGDVVVNLQRIFEKFPTRKDCIEHLEKVRWNGDPRCPYCRSDHNVPMQDRHYCHNCKTSFRVTVGTLFHRTHLPLQTWFLAIALMLKARRRITALQLSRELEVNKNTACRIHRKIRQAMARSDQRLLLIGVVGMDATQFGGSPQLRSPHRRVRGLGRGKRTLKDRPLTVIAGEPYRPLFIEDMEIPCYVLEDETRVLWHRGMYLAMGSSEGGAVDEIPVILASEIAKPFISEELSRMLKSPVRFKNPAARGNASGYPAEFMIDICQVIVDLFERGALGDEYARIARRCAKVLGSCSRSDIIALVDEATGYGEIRRRRALEPIIEEHLPPGLQRWAKIFPDEFFREIFRLHQWNGPEDIKRPSLMARYIHDLVFRRLDRSVLEALGRETPKRRPRVTGKNLHQPWLYYDSVHPGFRDHLLQVMALMRASPNWKAFLRMLERAFPVAST